MFGTDASWQKRGGRVHRFARHHPAARALLSVENHRFPFAGSMHVFAYDTPGGCRLEGRVHYSHTTPSPSASRMYRYAGCERGTGAIPCRRASLWEACRTQNAAYNEALAWMHACW